MTCRTLPVPGRDVLVVPIGGVQRFGRPKRINGGWLEMIKLDDYQDQRVGACGGVPWGVPLASSRIPSGLVAFGYRSR